MASFLSCADHRHVIAVGPAVRLRHHAAHLLHRIARLGELELRAFDQRARVDVDAHALERERIQLRRQRVGGARGGQHGRLRPVGVLGQLLVEGGQRGAGVDLVLVEQLLDAGAVGAEVVERLLHLHLRGLQQAGLRTFLVTLARQRGERGAAGCRADVRLQALHRHQAARLRGLVGEQALQPAEHGFADVQPRPRQAFVDLAGLDGVVGRLHEDLQILADVRVLLRRQLGAQRIARLGGGGAVARGEIRTEVGDLVVEAGYAEEGELLRLERRLRHQQDLRVRVAARHPGGHGTGRGLGGGRGGRGEGRRGQGEGERQREDEGLGHGRRLR